MGVQIKHKQEPGKEVRSYVCMHGLHPVPKAAVGECFESQLLSSLDWLGQRGGGLLLGDFNRVVCRKWRCSGAMLNAGDRALRQAARWSCASAASRAGP